MTRVRPFLSVLGPTALLALFLGAFRQTETDTTTAQGALACDRLAKNAAILENCVATDPTDAALRLDLARAYESAGDSADAEVAYRRLLDLDPRNSDAHTRLGELLVARGDRAGAWREAEQALRWRPGSGPALALAARSSPQTPSAADQ